MNVNNLAQLPRRQKQGIMIAFDVLLLPFAFWSALALRFSSLNPPISDFDWLLWAIPFFTVPVFVPMGLYRTVIRYADERLLKTAVYGVSVSVFIMTFVIVMLGASGVPRSSLAIFWLLAIMYIGFSRWLARKIIHGVENRVSIKKRQKIAVYGAGKAGVQLAMALSSSPEFQVLAFFDDSPDLDGADLMGIRVHSPDRADRVIAKYDLQGLILALPSSSRSRRREIIQRFEKYGLSLLTLPGMAELVGGKVRVEDLREVGIEDLLGRDPVPPDEKLLGSCINEKVVLVTGAGGSIGSELCRQIIKNGPSKLVIFENSEFSLYKLEQELLQSGLEIPIVPVLGDVKSREQVLSTFKKHRVQTVYHAAAYKHVPLVEWNVSAGIQNNVLGTWITAECAAKEGIETFVLISTDKAVRPTNVMGASKRLAELVLQAFATDAEKSKTRFCMVRFGNVLGSSGSVVPLFKEQIRKGGPVTVTHPEVTRYFMTIPEAAQLVLQAGSMGAGGDVFVLDMGDSVKIVDLARKMIHMSGLTVRDEQNPNGDVAIVFSGLRPGEKLYEELLIGSNVTKTYHPRIMRAEEDLLPWSELRVGLENLFKACESQQDHIAKELLRKWVREYKPAVEAST